MRWLHGAAYWMWRGTAALAQRLPSGLVYAAAVAFGDLAYVVWIPKRRIAKRNFAVVLRRRAGDVEVARVARRSFRNFAKYLTEIMRFPALAEPDFDRLVDIDGMDHLRAALQQGRGVIFVSIHFGNFELGGARIARDVRLNVIADDLRNARLMDLLAGNRAHKNISIISPEGAARRVLQALKRNEMVGLMMDLGPRAQDLETVEVDFFGTPTAFPSVAASLARVSGAPIIVAAVVRERDNTFRGIARPPIFVARGAEAAAEIQRATQTMVHGLEEFVRSWPDQWYIFRPMWPVEA